MKLPFINAHIVKSETLDNLQDVIDAYTALLDGSIREVEQVALALHELKAGGSAHWRRKRLRALDRRLKKLDERFAVDNGDEAND